MNNLAPEGQGEWPTTSAYFDPITMNAQKIRDLVQERLYGQGGVDYFQFGHGQRKNVVLETFEKTKLQLQGQFKGNCNGVGRILLIPCGLQKMFLAKACWQWLLEEIDVHPAFVMLSSSKHEWCGGVSTFKTVNEADGMPLNFHILAKFPSSGHIEAAFYLRIEIGTGSWTLLHIGNTIGRLHKTLCHYLQKISCNEAEPFAVLYTVLEDCHDFLHESNRGYPHAVAMSARATGLGSLAYSTNEHTPPENLDIKRLHWVAGNIRAAISAWTFQELLLSKVLSNYLAYLEMNAGIVHPEPETARRAVIIQEALEQLKIMTDLQLSEYSRGSAGAQAQLDGARMLTDQLMARQSKEIAEATRKDSNSMKTIAALTMAFLPATFMATVFSTVFFHSDASGTDLEIDKNFWIYVVAATIMTVLTGSVWTVLGSGLSEKILLKIKAYQEDNANRRTSSTSQEVDIEMQVIPTGE